MPTISEVLRQGWQLHQAGNIDQAEQMYRQVLKTAPKHADALVYLGIAFFDQRRFAESVDSYREAISIRPTFPIAWNNLGNSLRMLGEVDEAEACFEESLKQQPDYLSALKNRGTLWVWCGEIERGLRWYEQGLEVDPANAELHRNLGVINLLLGNYDVGWPEYRWRWKIPGMFRPTVSAPIWQGQSLAGKTILLYPEQGLGDAIQFVRATASLQKLGATVLLQCASNLIPLFTSAPGVDRLLLDSAVPPPLDFHASLIEVIDVLYSQTGEIAWGTELFQQGTGYLTVSAELIAYWKCWLDEHTKQQTTRVGINWQGNPSHHADVYRSIPLELLRPLSRLTNIELINLQFGYGSEQLDECDFADSVLRLPDHVDSDGGAFADTAAILYNLDFVISTDTAITHLAGAVGANVITMLGRVPDWRWLLQGESTLWYPTMKLVRQPQLDHWSDVIVQVVKQLEERDNR
jgi:tetratricopeptide (TPR) repeat protein